MIFETLWESAQRGELMLVDDGLCHWHLCKNGQITIREIIVLPDRQKRGIGCLMLEKLKKTEGANYLFSKCPADLESNGWYKTQGFKNIGTEKTRKGRKVNLWRLDL